jgi:hypothetical protein
MKRKLKRNQDAPYVTQQRETYQGVKYCTLANVKVAYVGLCYKERNLVV